MADLTQMLEHVINRGTGQKAKLPIFAAGKTGTSQNFRDAWFAGWTDKYIAVVWVGNDNDKPMNKIGGSSVPAQIWHDIMETTVGETAAKTKVYKNEDEIGELIGKTSSVKEESSDSIGDLIGEL